MLLLEQLDLADILEISIQDQAKRHLENHRSAVSVR